MNKYFKNLISPDKTLKEALKQMEQTFYKCLIVVNKKNSLMGTITDADIRRAIIKGAKFSSALKNLSVNQNRHINKNFQWNKLHIFTKKIKKWKYILYLDINLSIHHDINPILNIRPINKIFARADGFPEYKWKLSSQFDQSKKITKN